MKDRWRSFFSFDSAPRCCFNKKGDMREPKCGSGPQTKDAPFCSIVAVTLFLRASAQETRFWFLGREASNEQPLKMPRPHVFADLTYIQEAFEHGRCKVRHPLGRANAQWGLPAQPTCLQNLSTQLLFFRQYFLYFYKFRTFLVKNTLRICI